VAKPILRKGKRTTSVISPELRKEVMKVGDVAWLLKTSSATVYRLLKENKNPSFQLGQWLAISTADLEKWMERMTASERFELQYKRRH
jgi:excisionase family DNA binding protein